MHSIDQSIKIVEHRFIRLHGGGFKNVGIELFSLVELGVGI